MQFHTPSHSIPPLDSLLCHTFIVFVRFFLSRGSLSLSLSLHEVGGQLDVNQMAVCKIFMRVVMDIAEDYPATSSQEETLLVLAFHSVYHSKKNLGELISVNQDTFDHDKGHLLFLQYFCAI